MSYKVNPSAWGAAFPIPSQVVDKHIKLAGATQLKALLWLLRHASEEINLEELSSAIGQKQADTIDALHYWVETGILLNDDLPVPPDKKQNKEVPAESSSPCAAPAENESAEESRDEQPKKTFAPLPVAKPTYEQILARAKESADISFMFNEAQNKLGRTIGYEGQCSLLMIHDHYGLPVSVILMILEYAVSINKISYSYISAIGRDWAEKDIDTIDKADEQITNLRTSNILWKQFAAMANISNTRPTAAQLPYIKKWGEAWGFDAEMIYLAYEQMANNCQRMSLPYIDKVLQTWHNAGIQTPDDAENASKARTAQKGKKQNGAASEASYDLEEFKRSSLHDPIVYEKEEKEMSYSQKIYERANAELERRRDRAQAEQEKRHDEAVKKVPELLEIEKEMSATGLAVVKAIGMGGDAQEFIKKLAAQNLAAQDRRIKLLEKAGYSKDHLEIRHVCGKCRDNGYVNGRPCDCRTSLLRSLAFSDLSELSPVEASTFESFKLDYYPKSPDAETGISPYNRMKEIFNFCKDYAEDFDTSSPSLFLHGKTGLGKTHLSLAIAGYVVKQGYGVIYGSAQNLLNKLERERFSRTNEETGNAEQALLECDLLILDDLGTEFSTSFTVSAIYNIINTRISRGIPVIINTNLTPEELEQKYTQRITSRITGNYVSLQFCGRDIRQLKSKK